MINDFFAFLIELFIMAHTMGFELFGELGWHYQYFGLGYTLMTLLLAILSIILVLLMDMLIICGIYYLIRRISITLRTKETKHYNITGKVTAKNYHPAYTSYTTVSTGKTTTVVPHHHSEQHIVSVKYRDMAEDFDSKSLYNSCKLNDSIALVLVHKLDKNNKIIEATLELPE